LDDPIVRLVERRDRELDRLLAHLARARADAGVEQRCGIRAVRPLERALRDRAPETGREARRRARVTGRPRRRHPEQDRVAVAIVAQLLHCERVAGRLALPPQPTTRAAPEPGLVRLAREPLGFLVHPGEHQHASRRTVLHDRRLERHRSSTPRSRSSERSVRRRAGSSCRIEARSAAWATPKASATCEAFPAPPDAMTGTSTAAATAPMSSRS